MFAFPIYQHLHTQTRLHPQPIFNAILTHLSTSHFFFLSFFLFYRSPRGTSTSSATHSPTTPLSLAWPPRRLPLTEPQPSSARPHERKRGCLSCCFVCLFAGRPCCFDHLSLKSVFFHSCWREEDCKKICFSQTLQIEEWINK